MAYYNESLYDGAKSFYDYFEAGNIVSSGLFYGLLVLAGSFFIVYMIVKNNNFENNVAFLSASISTTFISLLLWILGGVGEHIVLICGALTMGAIVMYNMTK